MASHLTHHKAHSSIKLFTLPTKPLPRVSGLLYYYSPLFHIFLSIGTPLLFLEHGEHTPMQSPGHLPYAIPCVVGALPAFVICAAPSLTELRSLPKDRMVRVSFPYHSI